MTKSAYRDARPPLSDRVVTRRHQLLKPAPGDACRAQHHDRDGDAWDCGKPATICLRVETIYPGSDIPGHAFYVYACGEEHLAKRWRAVYRTLGYMTTEEWAAAGIEVPR